MAQATDDEPQFLGSVVDAEGFSAGIMGADAAANPYQPGTWPHLLWHKGWQDGRASRTSE
jgi:ribosome modulation factor